MFLRAAKWNKINLKSPIFKENACLQDGYKLIAKEDEGMASFELKKDVGDDEENNLISSDNNDGTEEMQEASILELFKNKYLRGHMLASFIMMYIQCSFVCHNLPLLGLMMMMMVVMMIMVLVVVMMTMITMMRVMVSIMIKTLLIMTNLFCLIL